MRSHSINVGTIVYFLICIAFKNCFVSIYFVQIYNRGSTGSKNIDSFDI